MNDFTTVVLGRGIPLTEIEQLYSRERKVSLGLPKLVLQEIDDKTFRLSFHEDHGDLRGLEEAKRSLRFAIHRRFPDLDVT